MSELKHIPSIFNDVLGPVMRGPSSSHSAAGNRIGRLCRDLVEGDLKRAVIEYDPNGSLVTTHESQGTDMGLYGGFLGWGPDDPRLPEELGELLGELRLIRAALKATADRLGGLEKRLQKSLRERG